MRKTPTPAKVKAVNEHDAFLAELNEMRNPQSVKRKAPVQAKVTKSTADRLADTKATLKSMEAAAPATRKLRVLLNKLEALQAEAAEVQISINGIIHQSEKAANDYIVTRNAKNELETQAWHEKKTNRPARKSYK